ncbi:MAG: hypothetical protein ACI8UO_004654, partial [Verrucomicrobiales bacterium]
MAAGSAYPSRMTAKFLLCASLLSPALALAQTPAEILKETDTTGGLVVHLGCGDGSKTAEFLAGPGFRVHGLDKNAENVATARQQLLTSGNYGKIAVDRITGSALPYGDNLVNLLVAESDEFVPHAEIVRVLVP